MMSKVVHTLRYDMYNMVVFLASDPASYINSQAIIFTGGQEMR
jgi:NAD(P)-dependent dehydrogenase (short-subunit alcohol dehydrogenase family)